MKFIEYTYGYSTVALNKYSCKYSKKLYSQPIYYYLYTPVFFLKNECLLTCLKEYLSKLFNI